MAMYQQYIMHALFFQLEMEHNSEQLYRYMTMMLLNKVSIHAVVGRHRRTCTQRCNMLINPETKSHLVKVLSNCNQSHYPYSQGPNNLSKYSNDFSLSATLITLNSLSLGNSNMLCTLKNTLRTIYHGKSSSNRVSKINK